jgi:hypothetical protein
MRPNHHFESHHGPLLSNQKSVEWRAPHASDAVGYLMFRAHLPMIRSYIIMDASWTGILLCAMLQLKLGELSVSEPGDYETLRVSSWPTCESRYCRLLGPHASNGSRLYFPRPPCDDPVLTESTSTCPAREYCFPP